MHNEMSNAEWQDMLNQKDESESLLYPNRDYETFKKAIADYIMTNVLDEDVYDKQKRYLQERAKPRKLSAKQWWLQLQNLN